MTSADCLHFTGHGLPSGELALEHECEPHNWHSLAQLRLFTPDDVKSLFPPATAARRPKLVFVSACHSELIGQAFVECGVPHVVAIHQEDPILDDASREFATTLYMLVLEGRPVKEAFDLAVASVLVDHFRSAATAEHEKFLLLPRDAPAHADAAFPAAPGDCGSAGSFRDVSPRPPPGNLSRGLDVHFVGRRARVAGLYRKLHHPVVRCVAVLGLPGSGKSECALRALRFSRDRAELGCYLMLDCGRLARDALSTPEGVDLALGRALLAVQQPTLPGGAGGPLGGGGGGGGGMAVPCHTLDEALEAFMAREEAANRDTVRRKVIACAVFFLSVCFQRLPTCMSPLRAALF